MIKNNKKNMFVTSRRVEFMDTDMAGIVHFTSYFRYMETAEHDLFRHLGLPAATTGNKSSSGWPRVSCSFDFKDTLRFPDTFEVHLGVTKIEKRSVTYEAEIIMDQTVLARGRSTSVYCNIDKSGKMHVIDIPKDITKKLKKFLIPDKEKNKTDEI